MANYTILLIDYEPRSIERFRDPLVGAGYKVEISTDGVSGIEAFHRLNPDMVLVEAMIPKKHGFEVCQELKRTPHGRRTPVLITTSVYKGRKYRTQALHIYGCDEYIEKPIAPEQLLEVVGRFLGGDGSLASADPGHTASIGSSEPGGGYSQGDETTDAIGGTGSDQNPGKPPRSTPTAQYVDDGEAEITARLEALLSGASRQPGGTAPIAVAVAGNVEVTEGDTDPLASIRAELNAELGVFSDTAGLDIDDVPEEILALPSDQAPPPSVIETLPAPAPEAEAPTEAEQPGKILTFEVDRSRASAPAETTPKVLPQRPKTEAKPPVATRKRRLPAWMWGALVLAASAGLWVFFQSSPNGSSSGPIAHSSAPEHVAPLPAPVVAEHAPAAGEQAPPSHETVAPESKSLDSSAQAAKTSEPKAPEPKTPQPKLVAESQKPVSGTDKIAPPTSTSASTPKKQADKSAAASSKKAAKAAEASQAVAPPATVKHVTGDSLAAQQPVATHAPGTPSTPPQAPAAQTPVPSAPAAPDTASENGPGVEAVPESDASASTQTLAPGTLLPIDQVDVVPVSISHAAPVYPPRARQMRVTGTVLMNVLVNERGTVDQVVLVWGASGADFNQAAIAAAKTWTYRPASKHGVPVKVWKSERVVFRL